MSPRTGLTLMTLLCLASASVEARGPWRASEDNTAGWQLMSPQERIEHQRRIRQFDRYEACHAYQLEHHAQLVERARDRGLALPEVGRDACAHLLGANGRSPP